MIWSGRGILTMLIPVGLVIIINFITQALFGRATAQIYEELLVAGAILGAIPLIWYIGRNLNSIKHAQILIEKETGKEVIFRPNHSFFFIRMEYWPFIFLVWEVFFWLSRI